MRAKLALLVLIACCSFGQLCIAHTSPPEILKYYREANSLFFSSEPTTASDDRALELFERIIHIHRQQRLHVDTVLFNSYVRHGVLLEVKGQTSNAHHSYLQALACKQQLSGLKGSELFPVYLYVSATSYHLNNYDSAKLFLDEAESIIQRHPGLPEEERLYNSLGALYYESGNYHQSMNYFTKALKCIQKTKSDQTAAVVNFQNNIAACLNKLESYREALSIYHSIVQQNILTSHIYQNMGNAYRGLGEYRKALNYFRRADPGKTPGVQNEIAFAYIKLKKYDSANYWLNRSLLQFSRKGAENRISIGMNNLYRSDLLMAQGKVSAALPALQKAILAFANNFNGTDAYTNPSNFVGSFASYKLFDALSRKAIVFKTLYQHTGSMKDLIASLNTAEAAINLLRYIERNYETDDARLFLKKNSHDLYRNALNICVALYDKTNDRTYLEKAFVLTEQNKASVLAININERNLKRQQGIPPALVQREKNLRFNISRLQLKIDNPGSTAEYNSLVEEKLNDEIELLRLMNEYEKINSYYSVKFSDRSPTLKDLQKSLNNHQAVISFYAGDSVLHAFVVSKSSFEHITIPAYLQLQLQIQKFVFQLRQVENGRRFKGGQTSSEIYNALIVPLMTFADPQDEWIIIPDGILSYLPFESLQEQADGPYLLESRTISYHFSAQMLQQSAHQEAQRGEYKVLAFAPFANYKYPGYGPWKALPSSKTEIGKLPGSSYFDELATRETFVDKANQFPVIHLASHAVSNITDPSLSYISFFGSGIDSGKLYLRELYGIEMDSVAMVIISACEAGDGKLVNSEGVISLSRGFAYAGCRSTVTSLWKANDASTAAILQKFHMYLQKGYSRARALQQAKLDYLKGNALNRSPGYWAHLVLFGESKPLIEKNNELRWLWIGAALILVIGFGSRVRTRQRKKEKKSTYS